MKNELRWLATLDNRSDSQMEFLFGLCESDLSTLLKLLAKLKENHVFFCPGDVESRDKILAIPSNGFT